jgi:hypothetical protein
MKKLDPVLATLWSLLGGVLLMWSLFDSSPKADLRMTWALAALILGRIISVQAELDRWRHV